jgi:murein DD-endopeptidase MepM/ murein hydrolase activator NlpD
MSAIINQPDAVDFLGSLGPDGVRRYKTRCKVLLDGHLQTETLVLIDDVVSVQTSKTIKGAGQATFILTPSENYLNIIFPNDYVNIYFDIGDGSGWTRTFFGLVDRIEEEYVVAKEGQPRTTYKVVCSDFHKVFERSMVYFNPHLANRDEFQNYDFAKANIAGLSLMTKGILAGGTPPDIILNVITQMIGFGTQFQLPSSYFPGSVQDRLRKKRAADVVGRLPSTPADLIGSDGQGYLRYKEKLQLEVTATVDKFGKLGSIEEQRKQVAEELGITLRGAKDQIATPDQIIQQATDEKLRKNLQSVEALRGLAGTAFSDAQRNISTLESTVAEDSYLIDILDMYTFIEKRAMDGYLFGQPVWEKQGSLLSILRTFSNEPINELFFDLRPLSSNTSEDDNAFRPVEGAYSIIADDKKGNLDDGEENGITMIPAVIMREYPFSMIEGLDLSEVELLVKSNDKRIRVGQVPFGAIFSSKPNQPGRHVVDIPNINVDDRATAMADAQDEVTEPTALGYKHLDVAVVSEGEIMKSTLGRSDADHFNLFEFYSDAVLGSDQRFYMKDLLPIITPIHILRHGLRVRTVTTRAARFSLNAVAHLKGFRSNEPEKEDASNKTDGTPAETDPTQLGLPVDPADVPAETIVCWNGQQSDWGYRPKPRPGRTDGPDAWVFHQGLDISKNRNSNISTPIPIRAIADGEITHAVPDKGKAGYGNYVVIRHNFTGIKGMRSSTYAHLSAIHPKVMLGGKVKLSSTARQMDNMCSVDAEGVSNGKMKAKQVKKGQIIGYMGNTGTGYAAGVGFHLHFEITRHFAPKKDSVTRRIPFTEVPQNGSTPSPPAGFDPYGTSSDAMRAADQNSCDPVRFYSAFGKDLVGLLNASAGSGEEGDNESDNQDPGDGSPEEQQNPSKVQVAAELDKPEILEDTRAQAGAKNSVDSGSTRRQIIRWALLQDHWYQHNLEFLSGRIDMRGAPEIRVGYRLDIQERNMSFYVEGVNHSWSYPNSMKTNLQVSRGQPNNPWPLYVYPYFESLGATDSQRRNARSRLATYFLTPDPIAIRRSLFLRGDTVKEAGLYRNNAYAATATQENGTNIVDSLDAIEYDAEARISEKYNEMVVPAGRYSDLTDSGLQDNEDARDNSGTSSITGTDATGLPKLGSMRKRKRRR